MTVVVPGETDDRWGVVF